MLQQANELAQRQQEYEETKAKSQRWLENARRELDSVKTVEGDKVALQAKLEKLARLRAAKTEGEEEIEACVQRSQLAAQGRGNSGKDAVKKEVEELEEGLDDYLTQLAQAQNDIESAVRELDECAANQERLTKWLAEKEKLATGYGAKNSLEEKREQLRRFKVSRCSALA